MRSRPTRAWFSAMVVSLLAACNPPAQGPAVLEELRPPVEARSRVDRAVATTGDVITYTVTLDYDPSYEIAYPESGAEIAGFRIIDIGSEEPRDEHGRRVEERWYKLRADLVGHYVLPPVSVAYRPLAEHASPPAEHASPLAEADAAEASEGEAEADAPASDSAQPYETLRTSEIFVEVESVLPADGEATDIRGLKPLREIERPTPWWWLAAGGGVVLLFGLAGFLFWRRSRRTIEVPPRPAHEIAFEALERLRHTDFEDEEAMRLFHFEISEVVRTYVESRFQLNATDLTTEEIVDQLDEVRGLGRGDGVRLRGFLGATDQVKFAAYVPAEAEIGETYEGALSFVESTRERPLEAASEADAANDDSGDSTPTTEAVAA